MTTLIDSATADARVASEERVVREVFLAYRDVRKEDESFVLSYPPMIGWDSRSLSIVRRRYPEYAFELLAGVDDASVELRVTGEMESLHKTLRSVRVDRHQGWRRVLGRRLRLATSPFRLLPDFLIIGSPKCGTTALFRYLAQHPSVARPVRKELLFFDRGMADGIARYRAKFPTVFTRFSRRLRGRACLTGDGTPTYLNHPLAPERARRAVPNARLIALLRDPVERAYSLYHLKLRTGYETLSFEEALDRDEQYAAEERRRMIVEPGYHSLLVHHLSYLSAGIYVDDLVRWTEHFPREQLLVTSSRELKDDRRVAYGRVLSHLRLPAHEPARFRTVNRAFYPEMAPSTRERLRDYYRPHNERLWEFLGTDYGWNDPRRADTGSS